MMPFTPPNENIERVIKDLEQGLPEDGPPAAQGGIGADTPDMSKAQEALEQEGVLDESQVEKKE